MPTVGNSSVGMAKAALEVINGVNLFGKHGAHWSVIFVDIDAHYRNRTTVDSILARESASKVVQRRTSVVSAGGRGVRRLASLCFVAYLFLSVTDVVVMSVAVTAALCATYTRMTYCVMQHVSTADVAKSCDCSPSTVASKYYYLSSKTRFGCFVIVNIVSRSVCSLFFSSFLICLWLYALDEAVGRLTC